MKLGRMFGIGLLALAVGCGRPNFEKRDYKVEDISSGKVRVAGELYTARGPAGYTEYIDFGPGGNLGSESKADGTLDEKKVYKYEKIEGIFGLSENHPYLDDHIRLTEDSGLLRFGGRREEWDFLLEEMRPRIDRYVLRSSEEGQRLQAEFEERRAKTPEN